jgi:hypothetical protein
MDEGRQVREPARAIGAHFIRACVRVCVTLAVVGALIVGVLPNADAAQGASGRLYRYTNAQGSVEIAHAIPAERVAGGYEILDAATGRVLETVAAQLSPEALVLKQARDREAEACRQHLERVRALYGSVADIDAAEVQAHRALETRIGHLQASSTLEQRRLEELERDAAQRERTGRVVTAEMEAEMARSRARVGTVDGEIAQRRQEQAASKEQFERDRDMFRSGECEPAATDD